MTSAKHTQLLMQLGDSLSRTGRKVWARYDDNYTCLTPALDKVLGIVATEGPVTVTRIARYLLVSPGAATQHISALEEEGAISRVAGTKDRREIIVQLTPHGRKLYASIRAKRLLLYEDVFGNLTDDELHTLTALLTKASADQIQRSDT